MMTRKYLLSILTALLLITSGNAQAFFCKSFFGGSKRPPPPPAYRYMPPPRLQYGYYYPVAAPVAYQSNGGYQQLPAITPNHSGQRSRSCFFN